MPILPVTLSLALTLALPMPALAEPAFAPGKYGEPFVVQGLVQGCMAEEEGEFCVVNAEGWRWIIDATGPTPPELSPADRAAGERPGRDDR